MWLPYSIFTVIFPLLFHFSSRVTASDFTIHCQGLYPENGASLPSTGMMYFSSVFKSSVVKYDPKTKTCKEIRIPSITGNNYTHVTGIEADRNSPLIWAVPHTTADFKTFENDPGGFSGLVSINSNDEVVNIVDLNPALLQAREYNGGLPVGAIQDATTDHAGNIYVIASWGQAILKVNKQLEASIFFAEKNPTPLTTTYTGIELGNANNLIVWNQEMSQIETFDLNSEIPQPSCPDGGKLDNISIPDALFIPSFSKGTCLLLSSNQPPTVEVFVTKDSWRSVIHTASINATTGGGFDSFTYELGSRIYYGVAFFDDPEPRSRKDWFQGDITKEVKRACSRKTPK